MVCLIMDCPLVVDINTLIMQCFTTSGETGATYIHFSRMVHNSHDKSGILEVTG